MSVPKIILRQFPPWWAQNFLNFIKICACSIRLNRDLSFNGTFCHNLFLNPYNLDLEWTFGTFLVLKMAFWWTQKFFNFNLISACGSCSKRFPVKVFGPTLPHLFFKPPSLWPGLDFLDIFSAQNDFLVIQTSNSYNWGLEWTFWTFSMLNSSLS